VARWIHSKCSSADKGDAHVQLDDRRDSWQGRRQGQAPFGPTGRAGEEEKGKRVLWRCSRRKAVPKARGRSDAEEHGDPGAEGGGEGSAAAERIFWREL
jgi:hypothetical protein